MLKAKTQIIGNVGKIECQYTPKAKLFCKFSVAVNYGENDTDWYNCIAWEWMAEKMQETVQVGTLLLVEAKQRIKKWEDDNGVKHTSIELTVTDFNVLAKGKPREEHEDEEEPEFMRE